MASSDLINILQEVRGTGPVNGMIANGIYFEIAINTAYAGKDGIYGHILYIYGEMSTVDAMYDEIKDIYKAITVTPHGGEPGIYGDILKTYDAVVLLKADFDNKYVDFLNKYSVIDFVKMDLVADNIAEVVAVTNNITAVDTVGGDLIAGPASRTQLIYAELLPNGKLDVVYNDLTDPIYSHINNAKDNAVIATDAKNNSVTAKDLSESAATSSQTSRDEAFQIRNELKYLSVAASTVASDQPASVIYTSGAGLMQFGIPAGVKGDTGEAGLYMNVIGTDTSANIIGKTSSEIGEAWISNNIGVDSQGTAVEVNDILRASNTSSPSTFISVGKAGVKGDTGSTGLGWTSGVYDPATGIVTFSSTDSLGFVTEDLRGAAGTATAGTTTTLSPGASATVTAVGTSAAQVFNFGIPEGVAGVAATLNLGATTTLSPGTNATVTATGTTTARVFSFGIPSGLDGTPGAAGAAATLTVGSTTTRSPGSNAEVVAQGTLAAQVFDFYIPEGQPGTNGTSAVYANQTVTDAGTSTTDAITPKGLTDSVQLAKKISSDTSIVTNSSVITNAVTLLEVDYQALVTAGTTNPTTLYVRT